MVTDAMVYAFHRATTDGPLGEADFNELRDALQAALLAAPLAESLQGDTAGAYDAKNEVGLSLRDYDRIEAEAARMDAPQCHVPEDVQKSIKYLGLVSGPGFLHAKELRPLYDWLQNATPPATGADDARDAARYRIVRRGQHWSVVDGIGNTLRAEALDASADAALRVSKEIA
ncbi:hypothetical protein AU476_07405 [Cupriavidus sp. UYMSc13B]|nr:hypothetical protein AU476_07405 [Cupriavidus sp. UYMSc13B]